MSNAQARPVQPQAPAPDMRQIMEQDAKKARAEEESWGGGG